MAKEINIISFNVPFPADYGGVIDMYYKLRELKKAGIKIHLHCFHYGREKAGELELLCESVQYYKRKNYIAGNLSLLPYIVYSRSSDELARNLLKNDFPILFEGLHSCYLLSDKRFSNRVKIYRESNIEHEYYKNLGRTESNAFKKLFFFMEAWKLKHYEINILNSALTLVVSEEDKKYLQKEYPSLQVEFLPSFHPDESVFFTKEKENFILYHGNLSVPENYAAAIFLIEQVVPHSEHKFVFAGKNPPKLLIEAAKTKSNVSLIANPNFEEMQSLIRRAKINLLYTNEPAGLKLKLLNVLFNGGHCLVNPAMLSGTGLDGACRIASSPEAILQQIMELMNLEYTLEESIDREKLLFPRFSNKANAEKLIRLVFP